MHFRDTVLVLGLMGLFLASSPAFAKDVVPQECRTGKALIRLDQFDKASEQFLKAIEKREGLKCGREGLADVASKKPRRDLPACAAAEALVSIGKLDAAETTLTEAAKTDGDATCVRDRLDEVAEAKSDVAEVIPEKLYTRGTNWVPSILYPYERFLLGLGVFLLAALAVASVAMAARRNVRARWSGQMAKLVAIRAVFVLGILAIPLLLDRNAISSCCHSVRVSPVELPGWEPIASAKSQRVGVLQSAEGRRVRVVAAGGSLQVVDKELKQAGTFDGRVAIAAPAGPVTMSVQVRDAPIWAFLTIAAGVMLGYAIHAYYGRRRPRLLLRRRALDLWRSVTDNESRLSRAAQDSGIRANSLMSRIAEIVARALVASRSGETSVMEASSKELDGFEAAYRQWPTVRSELISLRRSADAILEAAAKANRPISEEEQPPIFELARRTLSQDWPQAPPSEQDVKDRAKEVRTVNDQVKTFLTLFDSATDDERRFVTMRPELVAKPWTPEQLEMFDEKLEALTQAIRTLLQADVAKISEKYDLAETQITAISTLIATTNKQPTHLTAEQLQGVIWPGLTRYMLHASPAFRSLTGTQPLATVQWTSLPVGDAKRSPGEVTLDDAVLIEASIPAGIPGPFRLRMDGIETAEVEAGLGRTVLTAVHRFQTPGNNSISLFGAANQQLVEKPIEVLPLDTTAESGSSLASGDTWWAGIAGLVAVGSGVLALYLPDPAWGQPDDYLKALLWGSTISEGLRFVGNIVGRKWSLEPK